MSEKTRYSDEELQEFKELILAKLDKAKKEYDLLKADVTNTEGNDIADTSPRCLRKVQALSARKHRAVWLSVR